jgi:hypothetical protein
LCKKASKLITFLNVVVLKKLNLKKNKPIYFKVEFDFRGRTYYNTPLGVTYSKLNRFLFNFGYIEKKKIKIKNIPLVEKRIILCKDLLKEIGSKFKIEETMENLNLIY